MLVGLAALAAGCSQGDGRQEVSGEVTFQSKRVDQGSVEFIPLGGGASHSGAPIVDGRYNIPANKGLLPGKYAVKISWPERHGKLEELPGAPGPVPKDRLPPQYNIKTTLTREVKEGVNVIDFHLK
jgi:hypothetical protein